MCDYLDHLTVYQADMVWPSVAVLGPVSQWYIADQHWHETHQGLANSFTTTAAHLLFHLLAPGSLTLAPVAPATPSCCTFIWEERLSIWSDEDPHGHPHVHASGRCGWCYKRQI